MFIYLFIFTIIIVTYAMFMPSDTCHFGYCRLSHTLGAIAQWYVWISGHRIDGILQAFHPGTAHHGQGQHTGTSCDHIPRDALHKATGEL